MSVISQHTNWIDENTTQLTNWLRFVLMYKLNSKWLRKRTKWRLLLLRFGLYVVSTVVLTLFSWRNSKGKSVILCRSFSRVARITHSEILILLLNLKHSNLNPEMVVVVVEQVEEHSNRIRVTSSRSTAVMIWIPPATICWVNCKILIPQQVECWEWHKHKSPGISLALIDNSLHHHQPWGNSQILPCKSKIRDTSISLSESSMGSKSTIFPLI